MSLKSLSVLGSLAASLAATTTASAVNIHVTGDSWGVWVTGLFTATADPMFPGTTNYALADGGSGVDMDFFFGLPDGTSVTGSEITNRMITADVGGSVGDPSVDLFTWSLWVGTPRLSLHIIVNTDSSLLLSGVAPDGTHTYTSNAIYDVIFDVDYLDGTTDQLSRNVTSFSFSDVPTPGAAALLGCAGLTVARRRRS